MSSARRIVVALGGNAISPEGGLNDISAQFAQTRETAVPLVDILADGHRLLITHGNGPQVGKILRRVELAAHEVYPIDLGLCVADSQAGMGYMICQCMTNELLRRNMEARACTIVTTVLVDAADPALRNPTKPIGSFHNEENARVHRTRDGWIMKEFPGHGFRRVVPSPRPLKIQELGQIQALFNAGELVVAGGGGGIPVIERPDGAFEGVEAVVDKDLTAALLGVGLRADVLIIVTGVDRVCLNFDTPDQTSLEYMTVSQAREHLQAGQFPPGSMGPKIEAAIQFLEESGRKDAQVVITSIGGLTDSLASRTGTRIVRD